MTKKRTNLRLRVFAGPNGSGKSTIVKAVKNHEVNSVPVDFGIYVNADDIAVALKNRTFSFKDYDLKVTRSEFVKVAESSGLIKEDLFSSRLFRASFIFKSNG